MRRFATLAGILIVFMITVAGCTGTFLADGEIKTNPTYAVSVYEQDLQKNPDDLVTRTKLGQALVYAGEYERAVQELTMVLDKQPGNWRATYYRALAYIGLGDREKGFAILTTQNYGTASPYKRNYVIKVATSLSQKPEKSTEYIINRMDEAVQKGQYKQWYKDKSLTF